MNRWTPQSSDYSDALRSQNPWQEIQTVPDALAPLTYRPLAEELWKVLLDRRTRRHQLILGPRRVGKTTVMYQTVQQLIFQGVRPDRLWWLRLDHPLLLDKSLGDLVRNIVRITEATQAEPAFLFLDEITYAERWDLWLKTFYDEQMPVRIVGTSSATAAIRQRGTESGVGRWDEQYLSPYLFTEYLDLQKKTFDFTAKDSLWDTLAMEISLRRDWEGFSQHRRNYILTGGFPELLLMNKDKPDEPSAILKSQRVLRSDAIEKAIYKDIPQAFSIQEPAKLERLLYVLAGCICGLLSPNSIAPDIGLTPTTVEKYINYLERAFLVFTLNNYSASEETVQRRGKRLYFIDSAVRNAALLRGIAPLRDNAEMGHLIENMAASHLRALAYQEGVRLYHWRHKSSEVDLIYDHPSAPIAFEITLQSKHSQKGILEFQDRFKNYYGRCFVVSSETVLSMPQKNEPGRIPLDLFLCAVGRQEGLALAKRIEAKASTSDGQLLLF